LGKVALARGEVDAAEHHLLEAGAIHSPSPARRTMGPETELAARLLDEGRSKAVSAYLAGCRSFWYLGRAQIDVWLIDIRNGRTPDLFDRSLVVLKPWKRSVRG
jgi:hypothetical protein